MSITKIMFLLLVFSLGWSSVSTAQKNKKPNFTEGFIEYEIEVEGMPQAEAFLNSTTVKVFFKEKNSKLKIAIMGGVMSVDFINNVKADLTTMLMNIPGYMESTAVDFDKNSDIMKKVMKAQEEEAAEQDVDIQYYKHKRKRIAKYPCYLSEIEAGGQTVKMYLTEKLRPSAAVNLASKNTKELKGFPMSFEIDVEGMTVKITAIDVKRESVNQKIFDIPASYTRKSIDEFVEEIQEKTGGMGNGTIGL